jgi:hypothetical protein
MTCRLLLWPRQLAVGATWSVTLGVTLALSVPGCARTPPPVTEVEGVVLLDGKPLPQALVEFVPQLAHFGAEMNSSGLTDDRGRFTLTCAYKSQAGAVVGKHHVLVSEAPTPAEFRRPDEQTQARLAQHLAKLKNRPIPPAYGTLGRTPLRIEVKADQKSYELRLKRNP